MGAKDGMKVPRKQKGYARTEIQKECDQSTVFQSRLSNPVHVPKVKSTHFRAMLTWV